jgi:hypothetical protein
MKSKTTTVAITPNYPFVFLEVGHDNKRTLVVVVIVAGKEQFLLLKNRTK